MAKEDLKQDSVYILSLDAKDVYSANILNKDYSAKLKDGSPNFKKYINCLDESLDLPKLREAYKKKYRRNDFGFRNTNRKKTIKDKEYTNQVVNLTFMYSYKEYNKCNRNIFVLDGYDIRNIELKDCIYIENNVVVAIEVNKSIEKNQLEGIDCKYFEFLLDVDKETGETVKQSYKRSKNIKTIKSVKDLRKYLYANGFWLDGIHYVRWKRSSGSSRVGKCLFINEDLYKAIHKWDLCGLNIKEGDDIDLAAFEGAVSLSLSSIIDTIEISPEEILVIDDYDSVFVDTVAAVTLENKWLKCEPREVKIKNNIWDGQSLLDESVFGKKYSNKGMLLLRNRLFKSCCFHTTIQKWFSDNGITSISQLNGFTLATEISQIKMITTPSSIKYLKFGSLEEWLENIESSFGIVKYDKPTYYFDGRMVQLHYQLINTLQLNYEEVECLLKPSLDYIDLIKKNPSVLRYSIRYPYENIEDLEFNSKNDIVFALMGLNNDFTKTKYYYNFKNDLIKSMVKNLRKGHVLVNGTYATLFGNGLEMLKASIGKFDGTSEIGVGNIYCKMFPNERELLGTRSPHINAGNIYLAKNKYLNEFDKYFNLTKEIVCINAIGENIQQRLNGADYDSDTLALTDNQLLIATARKNYDKFLVPTSFVEAEKTKRKYTSKQMADLDIKTSDNRIGEIVNLSQELNSLLWHRLKTIKKQSVKNNLELYFDICKLAVLSGIEIDKAKKEYLVDSNKEIKKLKSKYKIFKLVNQNGKKVNKVIKPMFFKMITTDNGYLLNPKNKYEYRHTSMDYLLKVIGKYCYNAKKEQFRGLEYVPFSSIIKPKEKFKEINKNKTLLNEIVQTLRGFGSEIKKIYNSEYNPNECYIKSAEVKNRRDNYIDGLVINKVLAYLLFNCLDDIGYRDVHNYILQMLFGNKNKAFFELVNESREDIEILKECRFGDIKVFDFVYKKM